MAQLGEYVFAFLCIHTYLRTYLLPGHDIFLFVFPFIFIGTKLPGIPYVLVGNKCEKTEERQVPLEEAEVNANLIVLLLSLTILPLPLYLYLEIWLAK